MGTLGPNNGNTFQSDALLGIIPISNPENAQFSDALYATALLALGQLSNSLKVKNFNFNVPEDAIITGITVTIVKSGSILSSIADSSVKLVVGDTPVGNNKAAGGSWATSDVSMQYGDTDDLWGLALTPLDVNDPDFGVMINASAALAGIMQINQVLLQVDFMGSNRTAGSVMRGGLRVGDGVSKSDI